MSVTTESITNDIFQTNESNPVSCVGKSLFELTVFLLC
jgi:hypothetical protein